MNQPDKIGALNLAIEEMLASFRAEDDSRAEIQVAVITFGRGGARVHQAMTPASQVSWAPLAPDGNTPLGAALDLAVTMLEDRGQIPSRAYRPTIILVSDGQPTDEWKGPLARLLQSERASKAARFAMGIGADADTATLEAFLATSDARVHSAHEARQIRQFFRWVTLTVAQRSRHARPDSVIAAPPIALEDIEF
jgi:uncharacterized protein YegL